MRQITKAPKLLPRNVLTVGGATARHTSALGLLLLMVAASCLWFEHIQRSKFIQRHDGWLESFCRQGKARKQGSNPGVGGASPMCVGKELAYVLSLLTISRMKHSQSFSWYHPWSSNQRIFGKSLPLRLWSSTNSKQCPEEGLTWNLLTR